VSGAGASFTDRQSGPVLDLRLLQPPRLVKRCAQVRARDPNLEVISPIRLGEHAGRFAQQPLRAVEVTEGLEDRGIHALVGSHIRMLMSKSRSADLDRAACVPLTGRRVALGVREPAEVVVHRRRLQVLRSERLLDDRKRLRVVARRRTEIACVPADEPEAVEDRRSVHMAHPERHADILKGGAQATPSLGVGTLRYQDHSQRHSGLNTDPIER
jgi:hypothetical protein